MIFRKKNNKKYKDQSWCKNQISIDKIEKKIKLNI
jgi:hypothetical protein